MFVLANSRKVGGTKMKVELNVELKGRFVSGLQKNFGGVREGVHVSDLVYCLRGAFFRKVCPVPFTERQLGFFVDGARRHRVLQGLLDVEFEVPVEKFGVVGSVDVLLDLPLELKTTRAKVSLPDHYFRQLGYYAVLLGVEGGYLVVMRLNSEVPWEFYTVGWSGEEMKKMSDEMKVRADLLRTALAKKNVECLPKCEPSMGWKCRYCLYRDRCLEC